MTALKDNLNAAYLEAFAQLLPQKAPKKILVYVESDEDIAFWRDILDPYETENIKFDIQTPTKGKSKQVVLELLDNVGKYLLLCVDSDYDYLLPTNNEKAIAINKNPYIFHTYTYATENYKCYAPSLHNVCVKATLNDAYIIDFLGLLKAYSIIVYELFLWLLYFQQKGDYQTFKASEFNKIIKVLQTPRLLDISANMLTAIKQQTDKKRDELENKFGQEVANEVEELGRKLEIKDLQKETTYFFIQGHTLYDNVVLMFLKPICIHLNKEKRKAIEHQAKTAQMKKEQFKQYDARKNRVEKILFQNNNFKQCFLFQKIDKDIKHYLANFS